MKVESNVEVWSFNGENTFAIDLCAKVDDDSILFTFRPENTGSVEDWEEMVKACEEEDREYDMPTEGNCSISVDKKYVSFSLSRHGDGYGGDSDVYLPKKICLDAFRHIFNCLKENENENEN